MVQADLNSRRCPHRTSTTFSFFRLFRPQLRHNHPKAAHFLFTSRQGKRKSSKPPPKKIAPKIDTLFTCPFCNHDKAVIAKIDHLTQKGLVQCTVCGQKYTNQITHLSEPIDVYSDWIDACAEINKKDAES